ncbi:MAG: hypothetical protein CL946_12845 [Ectothiorhodospiraceae bacterium]|nr:hypothetical protein [Ectothiorhodospiraceae bacterium]
MIAETPQWDSTQVAVLPFTARGTGLSERHGYLAADRLTTLLFIQSGIAVVDRSLVNHELHEMKITTSYYIGATDIRNLGRALGANLLVLGFLDIVPTDKAMSAGPILAVTLRFVECRSGRVVNIIDTRLVIDKTPEIAIGKLLETAIGEVPW